MDFENINMKELIDLCNNPKIEQTSFNPLLNLPSDLYKKYFEGAKVIASGIMPERNRWYGTTVTVYKLQHIDGFFAIRAVTELYEDSVTVANCCHELEFYEAVEEIVTTAIYKLKKNH